QAASPAGCSSCRVVLSVVVQCFGDHRALPSFPTRRSSDLDAGGAAFCGWQSRHRSDVERREVGSRYAGRYGRGRGAESYTIGPVDRKSTRLNSSHVKISYAVFCLKKKKKTHNTSVRTRDNG